MSSSSVITVLGASGGVGASTLALAIGRRLAATGPPATVVDLDLLGGGLDVVAGAEHLPGRRWPVLAGLRGSVPPRLLLESLPEDSGCRLLSAGGGGPREVPASAVADVLDTLEDERGPVVLDLPRSSPHLGSVIQRSQVVILLIGLRTRALADADALVGRLLDTENPHVAADLRLVTRGPRPGADVLDDVTAHLGIGHLHHLRDDPGVVRDAERGLWPGTSRDAVRRCAEAVLPLLPGGSPQVRAS